MRDFQYSAGSLALDFVDTVAGRASTPVDLLGRPADLDRWFKGAGFVFSKKATKGDVDRARHLRDAIFDIFAALIGDATPPEGAIEIVNVAAKKGDLRPQWVGGEVVYTAGREIDAAFSRIAADAIENLREEVRPRLRRCPECKMLFRDNSRPGKRRWCSSSSGCGNRAKVRRHRANKRGEQMNG